MRALDLALIRVIQFSVFVLFTFMFLMYVGTILLLPLAIGVHLNSLLLLVGIPSVLGVVVSGMAIAFILYESYRIEGLFSAIGDIGVELVSVGHQRIKHFNRLAADRIN